MMIVMARITVEDCIKNIPNSFELVVLAAKRCRDITSGATITINKENHKNSVIALREIAEGTINIDVLRHEVIKSFRVAQAFTPEIEELMLEPENLGALQFPSLDDLIDHDDEGSNDGTFLDSDEDTSVLPNNDKIKEEV